MQQRNAKQGQTFTTCTTPSQIYAEARRRRKDIIDAKRVKRCHGVSAGTKFPIIHVICIILFVFDILYNLY